MKTNTQFNNTDPPLTSNTSLITSGNSSELGSQAPCIGDDPHEANCSGF